MAIYETLAHIGLNIFLCGNHKSIYSMKSFVLLNNLKLSSEKYIILKNHNCCCHCWWRCRNRILLFCLLRSTCPSTHLLLVWRFWFLKARDAVDSGMLFSNVLAFSVRLLGTLDSKIHLGDYRHLIDWLIRLIMWSIHLFD